MRRRAAERRASVAQAAGERVNEVDAEISARFAALAQDVGDVKARASAIVGALVGTGEQWLSSEQDGPSGPSQITRLRELRDELARAAAALEPSSGPAEEAAKRHFSVSPGSREPPAPRSGRDYDYFVDLRQMLEASKTGTNASPPA
jgi:hypothetical protein